MTATTPSTKSRVVRHPAADPADAQAHFAARLAYETDCSDVYDHLVQHATGVLVVDARSAADYADGHVSGAISLPHQTIDPTTVAALPRDALLVTYCWGPHCNGATQAAAKLAALGFAVKEMIGGFDYWRREKYPIGKTDVTRS
jgi:rhodanese-related sulfurtransferase